MGVSLETWRQRIGCFSPCERGQKVKWNVSTLTIPGGAGTCLRLALLLLTLLIVAGDVESNPGPNETCEYGEKTESYSTQEVLDILHNPDWNRVIREPPVKPRAGQVFLYHFADASRKDDWRCDQYHFHHDGTRKQPKKHPQFNKLFFVIKTSQGKDNRFKKHAYILLEGAENLVLFQYLGDHRVAEDLPHGNSKNPNSVYTRVCPSLLRTIKSISVKPADALRQLTNEAEASSVPSVYKPRSLTHIINTKCRRKTSKEKGGTMLGKNFEIEQQKSNGTKLPEKAGRKRKNLRKSKREPDLKRIRSDIVNDESGTCLESSNLQTICSLNFQNDFPNFSDAEGSNQDVTERMPSKNRECCEAQEAMDTANDVIAGLTLSPAVSDGNSIDMPQINDTQQSFVGCTYPTHTETSDTPTSHVIFVEDKNHHTSSENDHKKCRNSDEVYNTIVKEWVHTETGRIICKQNLQESQSSTNDTNRPGADSADPTDLIQDVQEEIQTESGNIKEVLKCGSNNTNRQDIDPVKPWFCDPLQQQLGINTELLTETVKLLSSLVGTWNRHKHYIRGSNSQDSNIPVSCVEQHTTVSQSITTDPLSAFNMLPQTATSLINQSKKLWFSDFNSVRQVLTQSEIVRMSLQSECETGDCFLTLITAILVGAQRTRSDVRGFLETLKDLPGHIQTTIYPDSDVDPSCDYKIGNYRVAGKDINRLQGTFWLDDNVIHAYLWILQEQFCETEKTFILPCFLEKKWEENNYTVWHYEQHKLEDHIWILLPICKNSHWFLLVANVRNKTVGIINSSSSSTAVSKTAILANWRTYMARRSEKTGEDLTEWQEESYPVFPQTDGSSCGVYVLMAADALLSGVSPGIMRNCHVTEYRKYVRQRLMASATPVCKADIQDGEVDDVMVMEVGEEQEISAVKNNPLGKAEDNCQLNNNKESALFKTFPDQTQGCRNVRSGLCSSQTNTIYGRQEDLTVGLYEANELLENLHHNNKVAFTALTLLCLQNGNMTFSENENSSAETPLLQYFKWSCELSGLLHSNMHDLKSELLNLDRFVQTKENNVVHLRDPDIQRLICDILSHHATDYLFRIDLKFIYHFVRLEKKTNNSHILLTNKSFKTLASRFAREILQGNLALTVTHDACQYYHFDILLRKALLDELENRSLETVLQFSDNCFDGSFIHWLCSAGNAELFKCLTGILTDDHKLNSFLPCCLSGNVDILKLICIESEKEQVCKVSKCNQKLPIIFIDEKIHEILVESFETNSLPLVHLSCYWGHSSIVTCLLEFGLDVNEQLTKDVSKSIPAGSTPACIAAARGHTDVIKCLIQHKADLNLHDTNYNTPLHHACGEEHWDLVEMMVEHCNLAERNTKGDTPLHVVCKTGKTEGVKVLMRNGSDCNLLNYQNNTPLDIACDRGCLGVVQYMLDELSYPLPNDGSNTPLHKACRGGFTDVVQLLLKYDAWRSVTFDKHHPLYFAVSHNFCQITELLLTNCSRAISFKDENGTYPLCVACEKGHVEIVKLLLENGADVSVSDDRSYTPLSAACEKGYVEIVKLLLENGANVSVSPIRGYTPLNAACEKGHVEIVKLSLENGADVSVSPLWGYAPLSAACEKGHVEIVKLLLENGADVSVSDDRGYAPLSAACEKGHVEIVKLLLENGADVSVSPLRGYTLLSAACEKGHVEIVKLLLEKGADVSVSPLRGYTLLSAACMKGHVEIVKLLLEKGADVSVSDDRGYTPLSAACEKGQVEIVKLLLEKGADVSVFDDRGYTPLNAACEKGHVEIVKLLLEKGADVSVSPLRGYTLLSAACMKGHVEIVKLLLEKGADVSVSDDRGYTPLSAACEKGHVEIVKLLLEKGADVSVSPLRGYTPLSAACEKGHVEIVKLLLENGADVSVSPLRGYAPLTAACEKGHVEIVKLLLEKGADVSVSPLRGYTPLSAACEKGHVEIVKLLLENGADVSVSPLRGYAPLTAACEKGHVEIVKLLLEKGADVSVSDERGYTPLSAACEKGHVKIVKLLLENGADVSVSPLRGYTLLSAACMKGHVKIVKLLLENGADVSVSPLRGYTPLSAACMEGNVEIEKLLLENGADVSVSPLRGYALLNAACEKGYVEIVKLLLENGADVSVSPLRGYALLNAACEKGHVEIVKLLLENGADVSVSPLRCYAPLTAACMEGNVEIEKLLLEKGADVSVSDYMGYTPLSAACEKGHVEIVKLLLENGADVSVSPLRGYTLLSAACLKGHVEIVKLLLENGADVSVSPLRGYTLLSAACLKGHVEIVKLLLEKGADVSVSDDRGYTPLNAACDKGHVEIVKLLLEKGADVSVSPIRCYTLLSAACMKGHVEIVKLLLEKGADVSVSDDRGYTPLNAACLKGHVEIVKLLLEKGADVSVSDDRGYTPLRSACEEGNVEIVKLLLEKGADLMVRGVNVDNGYILSNVTDKYIHCMLKHVLCVYDGHIWRLVIGHVAKNKLNAQILHEILIMSLEKRKFYVFQMIFDAFKCEDIEAVIAKAYEQGSSFILKMVTEIYCESISWQGCLLRTRNLNVQCLDIFRSRDVGFRPDSITDMLRCACILGHHCAVKQFLQNQTVSLKEVKSLFQSACHFGYSTIVSGGQLKSPNGQFLFHFVCKTGDTHMATMLLNAGVDVNCRDENDRTALYVAYYHMQHDMVSLLLKRDAQIIHDGPLLLHLACKRGDTDMAAMLLDAGVNVEHKDKYGRTALYTACLHMQYGMAKLLLERDAKITFHHGLSPLHFVCKRKTNKALQILLEYKPSSVDDLDSEGNRPLHVSVKCHNISAVKQLLKYQANINCGDTKGRTPLAIACETGNTDIIKILLHHKPSIFSRDKKMEMPITILYKKRSIFHIVCDNIPTDCISDADHNGNTLLHHACISGFHDCVISLLHRNVDKYCVNNQKETALHKAVENTCQKNVSVLLQFGFDCNSTNDELQTPLHTACQDGSVEIVNLLLDSNPQINTTDVLLRTPLHYAAKSGHAEITQILINKWSDAELEDSNCDKPLHLACDSGNLETVNILVKHTSDTNARGHKGRTPLHRAVARGSTTLVKVLLKAGAELLPNRFNNTPLYTACLEGHLEIVKLLLKHSDMLEISGINGYFYVVICCIRRRTDVLRYLIDNGASISAKGISCPTPLSITSVTLEDEEKDIDKLFTTGMEGLTPLDVALNDNLFDVAEYLLSEGIARGVDICEKENRENILIKICEKGSIKITKLFLDSGTITASEMMQIITEECRHKINTSIQCSRKKSKDRGCVKQLEQGCLEVIDEPKDTMEGYSPIFTALQADNHSIASLLIAFASGHLKNTRESQVCEKQSLLHLAYDLQLMEVVKYLISMNIDITVTDDNGYTVFHKACECGDVDIIETLLKTKQEKSNDINKVWYNATVGGEVLLHIAASNGLVDLLKLFLQNDLDMTVTTSEGNNAMHTACSYDKHKICQVLLDKVPKLAIGANDSKYNPIDLAIRRGNFSCLNTFMRCQDGHVTNMIQDRVISYMYQIMHTNNLLLLRLFVRSVPLLYIKDDRGNRVFHMCARLGNSSVMKYFVKKVSKSFTALCNNCGNTPLHIAVWHGHINIVKILVPISQINVKNSDGDTPLHFAAFNSHADIVQFLMTAGADSTVSDLYGNTPLHAAACAGVDTFSNETECVGCVNDIPPQRTVQTIQFLLNQSANIQVVKIKQVSCSGERPGNYSNSSTNSKFSALNSQGKSPLHLASEHGHEWAVGVMLDFLSQSHLTCLINIQEPETGSTPLHVACLKNRNQIISLLLEHGADTTISNHEGNTPVHVVCEAGHADGLMLLLPHTNLVSNLNNTGGTLLHTVCELGREDLLDLILQHEQSYNLNLNSQNNDDVIPVDICSILNIADNEGQTALHVSCKYGHAGCVKQLLNHRLKLNVIDKYGRTALHQACRKGCVTSVTLLLQHDTCLSPSDTFGMTPLHYACLHGSVEIADTLLEAGADLHIRDLNGSTPWDMCSQADREILTRRCCSELKRRHLCRESTSSVVKKSRTALEN